MTVKLQKTPLIARIEGAFVDKSVAVDASPSNLNTVGLSIANCRENDSEIYTRSDLDIADLRRKSLKIGGKDRQIQS